MNTAEKQDIEPLSVPGAAQATLAPPPGVATVRLHATVRRMVLRPENRQEARPSQVSSARWSPSVPTYRMLHQRIGGDCCWWMERARPDDDLAARLRERGRSIHNLYARNQCVGYFEIERDRQHYVPAPKISDGSVSAFAGVVEQSTHLAYFGLYPQHRGRDLGYDALQEAILLTDSALPLTLTTSSFDNPRALPLYLKAGFEIEHVDEQVWDVPRGLLP